MLISGTYRPGRLQGQISQFGHPTEIYQLMKLTTLLSDNSQPGRLEGQIYQFGHPRRNLSAYKTQIVDFGHFPAWEPPGLDSTCSENACEREHPHMIPHGPARIHLGPYMSFTKALLP